MNSLALEIKPTSGNGLGFFVDSPRRTPNEIKGLMGCAEENTVFAITLKEPPLE